MLGYRQSLVVLGTRIDPVDEELDPDRHQAGGGMGGMPPPVNTLHNKAAFPVASVKPRPIFSAFFKGFVCSKVKIALNGSSVGTLEKNTVQPGSVECRP